MEGLHLEVLLAKWSAAFKAHSQDMFFKLGHFLVVCFPDLMVEESELSVKAGAAACLKSLRQLFITNAKHQTKRLVGILHRQCNLSSTSDNVLRQTFIWYLHSIF